MKLRSRFFALGSALTGIALFIYVIKETGLGEIWSHIGSLGFGFLLILATSSTRYLSRSFSWLRCVLPEERGVGFWALWRARLAGEAIGELTIGPLVGEPMKVLALGKKLSVTSGMSSLMVEDIAYTVSSCLMVMAGTIVLLASFGLHESLRTAIFAALAMVFILSVGVFVVIGRRLNIGSNLAIFLTRNLIHDKAKHKLVEGKIEHLRRMENYIFDFYSNRRKDFIIVALCEMAFHLAGVLEVYLTLRLIGVNLVLPTAFMLEAVNRAMNIVFIFVPVLVGVDEAGTGLLTNTLGFGVTVGVALAIIRKIRMFFWIGIGLVFMAAARKGE
ncbi:MAG: flippase-like domain-containing protein [Blastocatellia bacterium]|nr:flippase-like domain-containing protein [Blastocatellia bacterium]